MASINISLSAELKRYVEEQVKGGSFGNVSEYVRSLIRDQQKRESQERLELLLLEGLASGSDSMTKRDWSDLRAAALKRAETKKRGAGGGKSKSKKDRAGKNRSG